MGQFAMTTRFPSENVEVGPFVAKIDFNPKSGAPHAVFIMARAGKSGTDLDNFLYELSTQISRVMQRKP
jgi:hypothetical protein